MRESGIRARSRRAFANLSQNFRGRVTGHDGKRDDSPARGFDLLAPYDLIIGPIATLHQNIGQEPGNGFARRQLIENNDAVHAFERRENLRSLKLRDHWPGITFEFAHAGVAVQPHDEHISELARLLQSANVAGVQQIETSVREDDAAAIAFLPAKLQNRFFECEYRRMQRISMRVWKKKTFNFPRILVYHAPTGPALRGGPAR
jgi:hypothetical protein